MIAAIALAGAITLATRNVEARGVLHAAREFSRVAGLNVEGW